MSNYLIVAFIYCFILTTILFIISIPCLRLLKFGQSIRKDGPQKHNIKKGTPTMGGLIIIIGFSIPFIIIAKTYYDITNLEILSLLVPAYIYLMIGLIDDYLIISKKNNKGISAKKKLLLQLIGIIIYYMLFLRNTNTEIKLFSKIINLGFLYSFFIILIYISSTNAVNLTDGIDGLACGLIIISLLGIIIIAKEKERNDIILYSICVISALLSFYIFNRNPAKIFMGNCGSLMFGSIIATLMISLKEELLIILIAFVFIIETLSVIIQVIYFKATNGKRIFMMAPLHHHFEYKGYSEKKIDLLFWILGLSILILLFLIM